MKTVIPQPLTESCELNEATMLPLLKEKMYAGGFDSKMLAIYRYRFPVTTYRTGYQNRYSFSDLIAQIRADYPTNKLEFTVDMFERTDHHHLFEDPKTQLEMRIVVLPEQLYG